MVFWLQRLFCWLLFSFSLFPRSLLQPSFDMPFHPLPSYCWAPFELYKSGLGYCSVPFKRSTKPCLCFAALVERMKGNEMTERTAHEWQPQGFNAPDEQIMCWNNSGNNVRCSVFWSELSALSCLTWLWFNLNSFSHNVVMFFYMGLVRASAVFSTCVGFFVLLVQNPKCFLKALHRRWKTLVQSLRQIGGSEVSNCHICDEVKPYSDHQLQLLSFIIPETEPSVSIINI